MRFVKSQNIQPGDILRVKRTQGYDHYGIAVDANSIIHYTGPIDDSITDIENVQIRLTNLDSFVRGDKLQVLKPYSSPFERNVVVERAEAFIGKSKIFGKAYNLVTNNCEHFARYIYFGRKDSKQVGFAAGVLVGAVAVGAAAIAVHAAKKNKKK